MEECADMPSFMKNGDRIVGGQDAPSPIPWQIIKEYGCGGTILDSTTILSAAHCYYEIGEWIRAGSLKRYSGGQDRKIAQIIENTESPYNPSTYENDFVIFKLDSPLDFDNDVQPACLPPSTAYLDLTSTEEQCFTSGWGTLVQWGSSPDTCNYVQVPAVTNADCNSAYGGGITESMICAGYIGEGGKDACQGDSGGPFVCNKNGKAIIAGVVSWGYGCGEPEYPGVYARTTHVLNWIKAQLGGTPPPPPSPTPDTTPLPGCGSPQWADDQYCDDENNNADCKYDGGACCNNNFSGMNANSRSQL
jgi:trypsin